MTDKPDNVVNMPTGPQWTGDSFINLLAGLGVMGRDKFAHQQYTFQQMTVLEQENAYRGDWLARKAVQIPAWDMTREWRAWQADPDQIKLLETAERKLFLQQKMQDALVKARLYGGAVMIIGVDVGKPEDELDLDKVGKDTLKFLHVVSRHNISTGPIIYDITSKYYGQPEYYEAQNQPASRGFDQSDKPPRAFGKSAQVRLHPSRVVKLIGVDTADQLMAQVWGDSVLQPVNDAIKACGLVSGSLATLCSELKIDVIKIPELKSILSTEAGTRKMLGRFEAANVAKSTVNTILIDGNEEWQRIQASLAGVPEIIATYMQVVSGAVDIPAGRFLGLPHRGLNVTGEADFRNYYDRLASEQSVTLQPAITTLDEVLIRSALGDRPEEIFYEWNSLWQLSDGDKADIALKKAQAYQIDVNAAQLPPAALANGRANQLIEDGFYPGLEQALEDAAAEGDTIEEQNAPQPMPMMMPGVDPATGQPMDPAAPPKGGNVTPFPPKKPAPPKPGQTGQLPFGRKSTFPGGRGAGDGDPFDAEDGDGGPFGDEDDQLSFDEYEPCHEPGGQPVGGQFTGCPGGGGGGTATTTAKGAQKSGAGGATTEVDPSKPIDPAKLTDPAERKSVAKYQSKGGFKKINKPLREGAEPGDDANNLSSVISKHSLAKDTKVYRGMGTTVSKQLADAWERRESGKPIVFTDKAFVSTSRSRGAAATFSDQIFELVIPKGHSALPLPAAKGMGGEAEILLDRNSKFRLVHVGPGVTKGSRLFKVELA